MTDMSRLGNILNPSYFFRDKSKIGKDHALSRQMIMVLLDLQNKRFMTAVILRPHCLCTWRNDVWFVRIHAHWCDLVQSMPGSWSWHFNLVYYGLKICNRFLLLTSSYPCCNFHISFRALHAVSHNIKYTLCKTLCLLFPYLHGSKWLTIFTWALSHTHKNSDSTQTDH